MADQSPELVAFNRCLDSLRRGVYPDDVVSKLFSAGIISDAEKSEANNYMLTKTRRAQILFDSVGSKVSTFPQTFHDLVRVLANESANAAIARTLQGERAIQREFQNARRVETLKAC